MLEITQALSIIMMFATLIQFCVDRVKEVLGSNILAYIKPPVWALGFGVLFALLFKLDIFAMFGLACAFPLAAQLVTGLIMSAGATPIHEFIQKLRQSRLSNERDFSIGESATGAYNTSLEQLKEGKVYEKTIHPDNSGGNDGVTDYA